MCVMPYLCMIGNAVHKQMHSHDAKMFVWDIDKLKAKKQHQSCAKSHVSNTDTGVM
jgi:hypothetical protein